MRTERLPPARRQDYRWFLDIATRWMDNDIYGHVNNVVYYSYFDTAVNRYLIDVGRLDIHAGPVIGIVPESFCRFHRSFAYPDLVVAGLAVARLGSSSVRYDVALFAAGEDTARADGHIVHVFVDRTTQVPTQMPATIRTALAAIRVDRS